MRVVVDGKSSSWSLVRRHSVVPQGSVLGPLLFLVWVNKILRLLKCTVKLFADDSLSMYDQIKLKKDLHSPGMVSKLASQI